MEEQVAKRSTKVVQVKIFLQHMPALFNLKFLYNSDLVVK